VSRVWEELFVESGGEREFVPRPISRIEGVVKDRGRVEDEGPGRAPRPEATPRLCVCLQSTGLALSAVGGTPRYSSAETICPRMVWGDASTATSAASADSKVTLIQCSPPANL
jgi:hypothetical protein